MKQVHDVDKYLPANRLGLLNAWQLGAKDNLNSSLEKYNGQWINPLCSLIILCSIAKVNGNSALDISFLYIAYVLDEYS